MIAVRLEGRLGNQLFQYAFIYSRAKELNTKFYIDKSIIKFFLPECFEIQDDGAYLADKYIFEIKGFKNLFSYHLRKLFYQTLKKAYKLKKLSFHDISLPPPEILTQVSNGSIFEGYFQSPLFFSGYENEIKRLFAVRREYQEQFALKYGKLYENNFVVCVHIRRTDYIQLLQPGLGGTGLALPLAYYNAVISNIANKNAQYIFIGDDHKFINENFGHIQNKIVSYENEITDFQHLTNANVCITGNSTFSWWGAWLNNIPGKIIYAPKYFLGWKVKKEFPINIYPEGWIQIEF